MGRPSRRPSSLPKRFGKSRCALSGFFLGPHPLAVSGPWEVVPRGYSHSPLLCKEDVVQRQSEDYQRNQQQPARGQSPWGIAYGGEAVQRPGPVVAKYEGAPRGVIDRLRGYVHADMMPKVWV